MEQKMKITAAEQSRMKELTQILNRASEAYYNKDTEIMSNFEYDRLYDELSELEKRTGIVLGACSGIPNWLDSVLSAVANGKPCTLQNGNKLSYVYLTDVFRAIVYALNGSLALTAS